MSRINGDKSRFNRVRKQNIRRRLRTQELLATAAKQVVADEKKESKEGKEKKITAVPAK